jgi:hypothetical protein
MHASSSGRLVTSNIVAALRSPLQHLSVWYFLPVRVV